MLNEILYQIHLYYKMAFYISGNPLLFNMGVQWHIIWLTVQSMESYMLLKDKFLKQLLYRLPAMCNDWGREVVQRGGM